MDRKNYRKNYLIFLAGGLSVAAMTYHWRMSKVKYRIYTVDYLLQKPNFLRFYYDRKRYEIYNIKYSKYCFDSIDQEQFIEECKSKLPDGNYDENFGFPTLYLGSSGYPSLKYKPAYSLFWFTVKPPPDMIPLCLKGKL